MGFNSVEVYRKLPASSDNYLLISILSILIISTELLTFSLHQHLSKFLEFCCGCDMELVMKL